MPDKRHAAERARIAKADDAASMLSGWCCLSASDCDVRLKDAIWAVLEDRDRLISKLCESCAEIASKREVPQPGHGWITGTAGR